VLQTNIILYVNYLGIKIKKKEDTVNELEMVNMENTKNKEEQILNLLIIFFSA